MQNAQYQYLLISRKQAARIISCFVAMCFLFSFSVNAQTGLTIEERFEEAERLFYINELERAAALFRSVTDRLCESERYKELCVKSLMNRGTIERYNRNFELSEQLLDGAESKAYEILEPGHPLLVKIYAQKTYLYEEQTNLEDAKYWADKTIEYVEENGFSGLSAARGFLVKAYIKSVEGNYREAVDAYNHALRELEHEEYTDELLRLLSQAHNNIGVDYRRLGMSNEARYHYQKAREVVLELYGENHHEMGLVYNSLGTVYYSDGDFGTAADYFIRSATIFKENFGEVNNRVAVAYNNAGICYFELGALDTAAEYFEIAQRLKEEIHGFGHIDLAVGYNTLGSLYRELGEYDRAEENYLLSIDVRKDIYGNDHPTLIPPLISLSGMYIEISKESLARVQLQRSLEIGLERLGHNHPDVIEAYSLFALSYFNEGQIDSADYYYNKILSNLIEADYLEGEFTVEIDQVSHPVKLIENIKGKNKVLNLRYGQTGDINYLYKGLKLTEIAADLIDMLQTSYQSEASKLNLIDNNYEIYSNALDVIYELYMITNDDLWLDEILYYSEKSRARIALELLQKVEARTFGGIPEEILTRENELNAKVTQFYQQLNLEEEGVDSTDPLKKSDLRDSLFYAQRELSEFTEALEQNYTSYYLLKYDNRLANRRDIQSLISNEETVISYSFGLENLYVLIIDKENFKLKKIEIRDNISSQVDQLLQSVTRAQTTGFEELAYQLYTQLLAPVLEDVRTKSLIFMLDQSLHYLPFEMLLTEESSGKMYHQMPFLVKNMEVQYMPSATVMMAKHRNRNSNPQNLLALAPFNQVSLLNYEDKPNERYLNELTPLPLTGYEAREIAKIFRTRDSLWSFFFPEQAEVLTDRRASKSRVLNGGLNNYGYIHFATHAFVNEKNPALSGIALYGGDEDDGIIYVSDIYNLQMNADLIVLGACETGLGEIRRGEGLIGFTRAFFYAGASNLVVSMWKVNDQPTATLMISFYQNIREGQDYGEALRNAKLELITHPEYAAPRNWAAFVLNGR